MIMSQPTPLEDRDATSEAALAGLRVVDMADEKGDTCGRFLADLGADVIRVEPPGGARSRRLPPVHGTTSLSFAVRNANKRGITLDLGAPGRSRAGAGAARVGGRLDRDGAAGDPGGAGPRRRRRAGPQPGARDHVDHRLRPERRLPRLGRQRRDPGRHERDPQPIGPDRARTAAPAAGDRVRDDRDPGRVGDACGLLEPLGDRTRRPRRLLDPRGGDPDMDPAYGAASVSRASAFPPTRGRPEAGLYPIFPCATVTCASSCSRRGNGGPCGRGSASPRRSRTSATTGFRRGWRHRPSCTRCTPRCLPVRRRTRSRPRARRGGAGRAGARHLRGAGRAALPARGAFVDAEIAPGVHGRLPSGFLGSTGSAPASATVPRARRAQPRA